MKELTAIKKQVLILFIFSVLISLGAIIHGIFFDLDFEQIKRLTFEGLILTLVVIFPAILFLEWIFDVNNRKKFREIDGQIKRLRKK
jgi:hypothetical protein